MRQPVVSDIEFEIGQKKLLTKNLLTHYTYLFWIRTRNNIDKVYLNKHLEFGLYWSNTTPIISFHLFIVFERTPGRSCLRFRSYHQYWSDQDGRSQCQCDWSWYNQCNSIQPLQRNPNSPTLFIIFL